VASSVVSTDAPPLKATGPAPIIQLRGTPREQGYIHGQCAREEILTNVITVRRTIAADAASRRDYTAALTWNEAFMARVAPELLDELHGIADGAAIPFHDILLLNVPVYLAAQFLPHECSQILLMPPATRDGRSYHAKTRDFNRAGTLRQAVLHRHYPNGRQMIEVNTAGTITWPGSGLNDDGVSISTSGVWSRRQTIDLDRTANAWFLINTHLLLRDSSSLDDVETHLQAQPRVTGLNIVATDGQHGAAFEATADEIVRHEATDGVVIRTNHYCAPHITHLGPTPAEHPSSHHRHQTTRAKIAARHGEWDFASLLALLCDHEGYPQNSLCRHADGGVGADTVYASIATIPNGELWTILDYPCHASHGESVLSHQAGD
jgi:isopenicillin-N N-acyltransferase-like protein